MPSGKVIGGVAALVFAILTGVFAWLADRESGNTESKKYKGFYAGSIVSGLLFLVSLLYAIYSAFMDAPSVEAAAQKPDSGVAPEATEAIEGAGTTLAGAPPVEGIVQKVMAGNGAGAAANAAELKEAAAASKAQAEAGVAEAARAAETSKTARAAATENAIQAARKAAASEATAKVNANAAAAFLNRSGKAKVAEGQTTKEAIAANAAGRQQQVLAEATGKQAAQLQALAKVSAQLKT